MQGKCNRVKLILGLNSNSFGLLSGQVLNHYFLKQSLTELLIVLTRPPLQ